MYPKLQETTIFHPLVPVNCKKVNTIAVLLYMAKNLPHQIPGMLFHLDNCNKMMKLSVMAASKRLKI